MTEPAGAAAERVFIVPNSRLLPVVVEEYQLDIETEKTLTVYEREGRRRFLKANTHWFKDPNDVRSFIRSRLFCELRSLQHRINDIVATNTVTIHRVPPAEPRADAELAL